MKNNPPLDPSLSATLSLSFQLGDLRFGLPFSRVAEIRTLRTFMPVLHAPDYRQGATLLHGRMLPLIDLRVQLNKPATFDQDTRLIVVFVRVPGADTTRIGILVDRIDDVVDLSGLGLGAPRSEPGTPADFVSIASDSEGRQILLLDTDSLSKLIRGSSLTDEIAPS